MPVFISLGGANVSRVSSTAALAATYSTSALAASTPMKLEPEEDVLNLSLHNSSVHSTIALQDAEIRCLKLERDVAQVKHISLQLHSDYVAADGASLS